MIPFTHHGNSRDLSEKFITYSAEITTTIAGTYDVFTHNHGSGRRFVPFQIGTYSIFNPTATISVTFGKVASTYNEWSAAAQILSTNSWVDRTIGAAATARTSFAIGDTMRTVVTYSLGSGTVSFRVYVLGVLVGA